MSDRPRGIDAEAIDEISKSRDSVGPFIRTEKASIEDMMAAAHSKYLH